MIEELPYRYERKFVARGTAESEARHIVRANPALFIEEYAPRWINNVYLDTLDLDCVRANADGLGDRDKLRVRWYGALEGPVAAPILEQKLKRGYVGRKNTHAMDAFDFGPDLAEVALMGRVRRACAGAAIAARVGTLRPVLVNRYWRRYFRSADGRVRLTIDARMAFAPFPGVRWSRQEDVVVIELKYGEKQGPAAEVAAAGLPFRITKNSKYVTGMSLTDPRVAV